MKKLAILLFLCASTFLNAQKEKSTKIGKTTLEEIKMEIYDKDSTASAVVLYEHANIYLDSDNDYNTRTDYYFRIKILNRAAFEKANIEISTYKKERAIDIKGYTYNLSEFGAKERTNLKKEEIFKVEESENRTSYRFTMPNLKVGSVIEYSYSIISPYLGINDWYFQADIPKIKSELDASILGNYKYNIRLVGFLKLDKNDALIKKNCITINGLGPGSCRVFSFGINNIPAFKEEDYMLSKKNYLSKLAFDLESYTSPRGIVEKYTTSWKEADKKLKKIFFNNQTSKKDFFKKQIPENILQIEDALERAQKIYKFIQQHFSWNERYWNNEDEKVKQAFANKKGSAGEINLSLFNALNAAEIKSDLVILSTRNNGIPTTLFPVIYDFNYVIIKITVNDKDYFLDATDKFLPFGELPLRTLNGKARVINYKKESNWVVLEPKLKTFKSFTAKLILNKEGELTGELSILKQGFLAKKQREKISTIKTEDYLEEFEEENSDIEVDDYEIHFLEDFNSPLKEVFKVTMQMGDDLSKKTRINPFFFDRLKENPFTLNERNYPVDFGYASKHNYALNLVFPDNYKITQLPKEVAISLPNKGGQFVLKTTQKENTVNVYSRMSINRRVFSSEEYYALKEFFKQVVIAQNSYITIEKK